MKLMQEIIIESKNGIDLIPAGTHILVELASPADLSQRYDHLKQLNPGMTFIGDPTNSEDHIDVQFRSGGHSKADKLASQDIIPAEWKQAAQAEGYAPEEIILFIHDAHLAPWEVKTGNEYDPRQEDARGEEAARGVSDLSIDQEIDRMSGI